MHYGLVPRANRGIFAINELPDLAGKIQVGLFNILQEGDVQIKGYPIRLPLDVLMVFSANPEDYTARGKIITPLKDRIGSEIRTHYPATRSAAMAITAQEAWLRRAATSSIPEFVREAVEEVAFQARADQKIDKRSGVSQRLPISLLENVVSNAERRALLAGETTVVPRITDIYAALPAITGKFELEYEGELRGADNVARDIIRAAVGNVFDGYFANADLRQVTEWFDLGGNLQVDDTLAADELLDRAARRAGPARARRCKPASTGTRRRRAGRRGDRLRARRPLRAEEDQPLRRVPVPVRRTAAPPEPARRADRAGVRAGDAECRGARRSITTDDGSAKLIPTANSQRSPSIGTTSASRLTRRLTRHFSLDSSMVD